MSREHQMKQPMDQRYALYCEQALKAPNQTDCEAKLSSGYIGSFAEFSDAREVGVPHPHDIQIRFYPSPDTKIPTDDFLSGFEEQKG